MKSFFLVGYFGFHNLGDSLILRTFSEKISKYSSKTFFLSGTEYKSSDRPFGLIPVMRNDLFKIVFLMLDKKTIIVAPGGELFQSRTSTLSFLYYLSFFIAAGFLGREYALLYQGHDEYSLRHPLIGLLFRRVSSKSIYFNWRDWPVDRATGSDILFLQKFRHVGASKKKNILLVISGKYSGYNKSMITMLRAFKKKGFDFFYLPFHEKEDSSLCDLFQEQCGGHVFKELSSHALEGLFGFFSESSFVITTRYHGAVLASIAKTPFYYPAGDVKSVHFLKHYVTGENPDTTLLDRINDPRNISLKTAFLSFSVTKNRNILRNLQKNTEHQWKNFIRVLSYKGAHFE